MDDRAPRVFADVADCVEATLARVGKRVVLCAPIGAGKPVALINEFWRRAVADPPIDFTILTGLTLGGHAARASWNAAWSDRWLRAFSATGRILSGSNPAWSFASAARGPRVAICPPCVRQRTDREALRA